MTRKLSKEEIKKKLDGEELDLSLCSLTKVPVREIVSNSRFLSNVLFFEFKLDRSFLSFFF